MGRSAVTPWLAATAKKTIANATHEIRATTTHHEAWLALPVWRAAPVLGATWAELREAHAQATLGEQYLIYRSQGSMLLPGRSDLSRFRRQPAHTNSHLHSTKRGRR